MTARARPVHIGRNEDSGKQLRAHSLTDPNEAARQSYGAVTHRWSRLRVPRRSDDTCEIRLPDVTRQRSGNARLFGDRSDRLPHRRATGDLPRSLSTRLDRPVRGNRGNGCRGCRRHVGGRIRLRQSTAHPDQRPDHSGSAHGRDQEPRELDSPQLEAAQSHHVRCVPAHNRSRRREPGHARPRHDRSGHAQRIRRCRHPRRRPCQAASALQRNPRARTDRRHRRSCRSHWCRGRHHCDLRPASGRAVPHRFESRIPTGRDQDHAEALGLRFGTS